MTRVSPVVYSNVALQVALDPFICQNDDACDKITANLFLKEYMCS